jgi:hypothetical protein
MHVVFNIVYLLIHLLGLILVLRNFQGTRALVPGVATFCLLIGCYALLLVVPRDLDSTNQWPGAAWLDLLLVAGLIGTVGAYCLVALVFALASPQPGGAQGEMWLALVVAALGFLGFYVAVVFNPFAALECLSLLSSGAFCLAGVAMIRRFRATPLGLIVALAFLVEGVASAIHFLLLMLAGGIPYLSIGLRVVGVICWCLFFAMLAKGSRDPLFQGCREPDSLRSNFSREHPELRWAIFLVVALFFWAFYEGRTGGPVAAFITWAHIPLPLVLLLLCWSGTLVWLRTMFDYATTGLSDARPSMKD